LYDSALKPKSQVFGFYSVVFCLFFYFLNLICFFFYHLKASIPTFYRTFLQKSTFPKNQKWIYSNCFI